MLLKLIDDMNRALEANLYFAALAIALMLPDICGKAAYPEESTGKRYIHWYDEVIGVTEEPPFNECSVAEPYLSGEVVYSLRCCFLHQGTPNIEVKEKWNIRNHIDDFILLIQQKNQFNIYGDTSSVEFGIVPVDQIGTVGSMDNVKKRTYCVNIRRLCMVIGRCAAGYYHECPEKFDFFKYTVVD